jgi:hypothetical protein
MRPGTAVVAALTAVLAAFALAAHARAADSHHRYGPRRTVTIVRTVSTTTATPPVAAFISRNGDNRGPDIQRPLSLWLTHGYLDNVKLLHLHWVDWGQAAAYSSATILLQIDADTHAGSYDAVTGGVMLGGLKQCGNGRWYYSTAVGTSNAVQLDPYDSHPSVFTGGYLATPC